jgi:hypothetical protein
MPTYLLTISGAERDAVGVRVRPGFLMEEMEERPGIKKIIQGCRLELRKPDGSKGLTHLVTYGVPVEKNGEGDLIYRGDIKNPEVRITLPADVPNEDVVAGTEVWLVGDESEGEIIQRASP